GLTEVVKLGVNFVVGDNRRRNSHAKLVLSSDEDLRTNLDVGLKDQVAVLFAGRDVDVGRSNGIDQGVGDGVRVKVRNRVTDGLGAQRGRSAQVGHQHVL